MKQYRLAVDENGSPFVLNSRGSIDFGYITEEMNLPPAPIRIAEGNENYGLRHMERNHSEQLHAYGFSSVAEFVEYVSDNFTIIKEGHSGSFLLEVNSEKNYTLFISLSKTEDYWKVISGGIFRTRYSKYKKMIHRHQ